MRTENSQILKNKVKVAVVGLGFMGVTHLRVYQQIKYAEIVGVCDSVRLPVNGVLQGVNGNIKRSEDINLGAKVKVYKTLEEVAADSSVDLVDLCTPTPVHAEQSITLLKAGKSVLCEKPLARTSSTAHEVLKVSRGAAGFIMPAMCMRFWPGWSWLKRIVEEKTYGPILSASFRRVSEMPAWSKQGTYDANIDSGGVLFDLHIHDTDFVHYLFGRPAGVFSTGVGKTNNAIDHTVTQYIYPGGPVVQAEGGWLLTKGFNMSYALCCEQATIEFDLERGLNAVRLTEAGQPPRFVVIDEQDGYAHEIRYAVDCVREGRIPEVVTVRDGVVALEICEAEEKSIKTGKVTRIG